MKQWITAVLIVGVVVHDCLRIVVLAHRTSGDTCDATHRQFRAHYHGH